ncbi:hypothetical protein [Streptomyces sp. ISL-11]|uniref:hypothetical protein n=1 Tax=Streptomyces sp. ISL-11 TaxID=2819174 RepID=UPI001BEC4FD0|nr:hypothetical protein [Streptomyces sp. ISL-11]MBT2383467.1 hypothetical protein [Streptomyces sp. ISL-11]
MIALDGNRSRLPERPALREALAALPRAAAGDGFGPDIDAAHEVMLAPGTGREAREAALLAWLRRSQPCLFGRLAARAWKGAGASKGLGLDICWILEDDLDRGHDHLAAKIWTARAAWKRRAVTGQSSAFLIVFNDERLARALPGPEFAELCRSLADAYLSECAPVEFDTVYAEAVPLHQADGSLVLFKASTQLFYTGAHQRRNHDRRIPGGVVISVNAPGHYAHSLVTRGLAPDLGAAMEFVRETAARTIGNGGIGHPSGLGSSWHNAPGDGCPAGRDTFSAAYQIDVLVQKDVVSDRTPRLTGHHEDEIWPSLRLDYLTAKEFSVGDPDHGWSNGLPIGDDALLTNPWEPVVAANTPDFDY